MSNVNYNFADRVAVVTGAAGGIGEAVARAFSAAGASVYLLDIDAGRASTLRDIGTFIETDVTSIDSIEKSIGRVSADHGRIDVLVNNAGGFGTQATTETIDPSEWRSLIDLNLTSVFLVCRAALAGLRNSEAGRIINIGSLAGQTGGYRTSPAYAAAKAGVHSYTRVLAHELAPDRVTVNALAPSAVLTDRIIAVRDESERRATADAIPLGRYQTPEELASWVLFLASGESGFMTGETVAVNGGRFMT
ncbi:MAG TPA: SDR family NAD(P)-dependent oxidoreductase [Acidimicrobiia bacterium]|jgi:3-oxoacyl-[acyl-carrier protein] reductase